MSAEQSLQDGDLDGALSELQAEVRKDPSNAKHRIFLFQLLCVAGQWDRANTQLKVVGELDAGALAMVQTYREALRCAVLREQVFSGKRTPMVFGEPAPWLGLLLEALRLTADGEHEKSQTVREQAFDGAPATSGEVDDKPFEWIADADPRLGPTLEAIINGRYYWVPFERIARIDVEEPADLRDRVWMPAHFAFTNGGETVGLIPTRYPGSHDNADAMIRLARQTEWNELGAGLFVGAGQRLLATEEAEYPLMDVRSISLNNPIEEPSEQAAGRPPDG